LSLFEKNDKPWFKSELRKEIRSKRNDFKILIDLKHKEIE